MKNNNILSIIIWILIAIILVLWFNLLWNNNTELKLDNKIEEKQEFVNIWNFTVQEFKQKIKEDYILIDIRTAEEISEWYIEWKDLEIDYYKNNFKSEIEKLDKSKKYLIYCRSGSRSWNALHLMKNLWFTNVHDLAWGIGAWESDWEQFVK